MAALIEARDPAHPARILGTVPSFSAPELEAAVATAVAVQGEWAMNPTARVDALHAWATSLAAARDDIATLVMLEVGKPIVEARAEVDRGVRILRYYAQAALRPSGEILPSPPRTELRTERHPIGPVLLITPWNFPVAIPLWKIAPALAFGNAVLFRPSAAGALTASRLIELAQDAVPPGVIGFVPCSSELVGTLLADRRIGGVSFTGSTAVGSSIVSTVAGRGGVVQAEMGGQNAAIVLDDADVDTAAAMISEAAMRYAGQKCTATRRVIVHESIFGRFVPLLVDRIRSLAVGDPEHETTLIGPLISAAARDGVEHSVGGALARGGRLLTGSGRPAGEGWYLEPSAVELDDPTDPFAMDETFGPAVSVQRVASDGDAVRVANASRYGLAGAVYGTDADRAESVARALEVGMVRVNAPTVGIDYHAPFGGLKASSYGPREQGEASREFFTTTRTVFVKR